MRFLAIALVITAKGHMAAASGGAELCDAAALAAAGRYAVPEQVMLAIARVESGRDGPQGVQPWPWAVNHAGESYWPASKDEAADFARSLREAGETNIDLGCFQLNLRWHGHAFDTLNAMLDPTQNADYAARFLVEKHAEKGNWVDAVAAYHSATPDYARRYVERVEAALSQLAASPQDDTPVEVATRTNGFPLLQSGTTGSLASLVPRGGGMRPLFVAVP